MKILLNCKYGDIKAGKTVEIKDKEEAKLFIARGYGTEVESKDKK